METLSAGLHDVSIDQGELVSYTFTGLELIHQKGSPGWKHADTEMFPIIGPTAGAGYRVQVSRGNAIQDQHGLLRELDYELLHATGNEAFYQKEYKAGTVVINSKYPDRSRIQYLVWPYSFVFKKSFLLGEEGLRIDFEIAGEPDMPYMLGYHPAFKLHTDRPVVAVDGVEISLDKVLDTGSKALEISDCTELVLKDLLSVKVATKGFNNFMLWTEVPNMLCVEPVTYYPFRNTEKYLHEGFHYLGRESERFEVRLEPSERR